MSEYVFQIVLQFNILIDTFTVRKIYIIQYKIQGIQNLIGQNHMQDFNILVIIQALKNVLVLTLHHGLSDLAHFS